MSRVLKDVFGNTYGYAEGVEVTDDERELIKNVLTYRRWTVLIIAGKGSQQAKMAVALMDHYTDLVDPGVIIHGNKKAWIFVAKKPPLEARPEFMQFCDQAKIVVPEITNN